MKHKSLFSLMVIVVAYIFGSYIYAQDKTQNEDGWKLVKINQRAYYQFPFDKKVVLTDSASKRLSLPRQNIYELQQAKASKGMDIPEAIVKVLGKEKIATFSTERILVMAVVNPSGKIVKLTLAFPLEYQVPLEDCARLIEFIKINVTLDVPQGKQGMFGSFTYAVPVSFLKK